MGSLIIGVLYAAGVLHVTGMACISTPGHAHSLARSSIENHGLAMNEVVDLVGWNLGALASYLPHTAGDLTNAFSRLPPFNPNPISLTS